MSSTKERYKDVAGFLFGPEFAEVTVGLVGAPPAGTASRVAFDDEAAPPKIVSIQLAGRPSLATIAHEAGHAFTIWSWPERAARADEVVLEAMAMYAEAAYIWGYLRCCVGPLAPVLGEVVQRHVEQASPERAVVYSRAGAYLALVWEALSLRTDRQGRFSQGSLADSLSLLIQNPMGVQV